MRNTSKPLSFEVFLFDLYSQISDIDRLQAFHKNPFLFSNRILSYSLTDIISLTSESQHQKNDITYKTIHNSTMSSNF